MAQVSTPPDKIMHRSRTAVALDRPPVLFAISDRDCSKMLRKVSTFGPIFLGVSNVVSSALLLVDIVVDGGYVCCRTYFCCKTGIGIMQEIDTITYRTSCNLRNERSGD